MMEGRYEERESCRAAASPFVLLLANDRSQAADAGAHMRRHGSVSAC